MSSSDTPTSTSPPSDSSSTSASSSSGANSGKRGETSPLESPTLKTPKIDDNSSNNEFIENFLECSVCLEFPSSPIHNCANAHFLCGQCAPKFSACPTCQNTKLSPNPVAEKLAKEANKKIKCANFEAGCQDGVLSTKFAEHLPLCYFRDVNCFCKTCYAETKFHQYIKHLEDAHDRKIQVGPKFKQTYTYDKKAFSNSGWTRVFTPVNFGCHHLIACTQISTKCQMFFAWLCILGDKNDADKYSCEIELKNPESKPGCIWTLPVLAYHEIPKYESQDILPEHSAVLSIPLNALGKFGRMEQDKIIFDVAYTIKDV